MKKPTGYGKNRKPSVVPDGVDSSAPDNQTEPLARIGRMGISDMSMLTNQNLEPEIRRTKEILHEAAYSYITIPGSLRRVKFRHIYIHPDDLHRVRIDDENIRDQDSITEDTVEDLLPGIKEHGIISEVTAVKEEGAYSAFDGSLRTYCAKFLKIGLPLRYTEEYLTEAEKAEISRLANDRVSNSIYEKGVYYKKKMQRLGVSGVNELARVMNENVATISLALRAADIPMEIYNIFPAGPRIGVPAIEQILRQFQRLTAGQIGLLVESVGDAGRQETGAKAHQVICDKVDELLNERVGVPTWVAIGKFKYKRPSPRKLTISTTDTELLDRIQALIEEQAKIAAAN